MIFLTVFAFGLSLGAFLISMINVSTNRRFAELAERNAQEARRNADVAARYASQANRWTRDVSRETRERGMRR